MRQPALHVRVLGPTEISATEGKAIVLSRPLERALAVRLALARGAAVDDRALVRSLWQDETGDRPNERLRVLAHRLRRSLGDHGDALKRTSSGYALDAIPVDLADLDHALALADHDHAAALALWRGPSLDDLRGFPFALAEGARLDAIRLDLRIAQLEAGLDQGVGPAAELEELVAANPLNERLVGLLVRTYYRDGRQADAFARLNALRATLGEELGLDLSPAIADLELRMLRQDPDLLPHQAHDSHQSHGSRGAYGAHSARGPQAPAAMRWQSSRATPFVGRDGERDDVLGRLTEPALVTLIGGPGVGKTRLAREVATAAANAGRPIAWLDLTPIRSAEAVIPGLAVALGLDGGPGDPLPRCAERLAGSLLVIDNAEHVVDVVASLAGSLRRLTYGLSLLVTSQRPLRIALETLHAVAPLSLADAVRLFCVRSGAAPDENAETICTAVDRSPLGIELAAGLTRTLTVQQLAARMPDRLRLLIGGSRDLGTRHSSLRSALDWSYSLLEDPARLALRRLGVFAGGCTLEAAEQVVGGDGIDAGDVAVLLAELNERSLITVDVTTADSNATRRFRLLETVRDFALEKLREEKELDALSRRHADWYLREAGRSDGYFGPGHGDRLRELKDEEANLRAAFDWAVEVEPQRLPDVSPALWWFWWSRGLTAEAQQWLRKAIECAQTPSGRAILLRALSSYARSTGDLTGSQEYGEEALALFRELGDTTGQVYALLALCLTGIARGEHRAALTYGDQAARIATAIDDRHSLGGAMNATGVALRHLGHRDEAGRRFLLARELWRETNDLLSLAGVTGNLAMIARQADDFEASRTYALEALRRFRDLGLAEGMIDMLEAVASVDARTDQPARALRIITITGSTRRRLGLPLTIPDKSTQLAQTKQNAQTALGPDAARRVTTATTGVVLDHLVNEVLP